MDHQVLEAVEIVTTDNAKEASHLVLIPHELKGKTTAQALVIEARINGTPVQAICGYVWVPSKDPRNYPVCSKCLEIYHLPGENREDRNELPPEA